MATPVVPNQFMVGKNRIVHKPTAATFSFDKNLTTFKSINWGNAGEQLPSGTAYRKDDIIRVAQLPSGTAYRKDDIIRVAQQLLGKLKR